MEHWRRLLEFVSGDAGLALAAVAVAALVALVMFVAWRRRRRLRGEGRTAPTKGQPTGSSPAVGLDRGLAKTRAGLLQRLLPLLGRERLDRAAVEALETALLSADVGVRMTERLVAAVEGQRASERSIRERFERELLAILGPSGEAQVSGVRTAEPAKPRVIMVVGVNGVGKTTTIGKLAAHFIRSGQRVLLVAADTFRAAAIEQLEVWAERTGADLVRHQQGADPGAVAYDGIQAAVARGVDVAIVDTAGRLHTKSNLMEELRKVRRVIARELPGAPHDTLLVIDAVTGQNGLAQGRAFLDQVDVTGVVLTKLDGTAKGGIAIAIAGELGLRIRFVGVGEGVGDLREFSAEEFVAGLLETAEPSGIA